MTIKRQENGLIIVCLLAVGTAALQAGALTPSTLECEARVNPIGIATKAPRLSWTLTSSQQGEKQTAYEIVVSSTPGKAKAGQADLWSTGRVVSSATTWIGYVGKPMGEFREAWWKVRVWSREGEASAWSEVAHWGTALLEGEQHAGFWIAGDMKTPAAGPMPIFRRGFTVRKRVEKATLVMAGLGFYEASVNGSKAGDFVLTPVWTNYRKSVRYNTYDVSSLVKRGANALTVMLGNGPFNIPGGRYAKYTGTFGVPRLWGQLHLRYKDGSEEDIATDEKWRTKAGPITFSDFYGGEDYDAQLEPQGWKEAGFDDSSWQAATRVESPGGELVADDGLAARIQHTFRAVTVTEPTKGIFVYDLGRNMSGWPRLRLHGKAGAKVKITPGELLAADGKVSQKSSGAPMFYDYTLRGTGTETWAPRFTYYGFRYVQIEDAAPAPARMSEKPVVESVEGEFLYLNTPEVGRFHSSSETLNRIHGLVVAAMKSNLQGVLTDCPHREKLGWLEQFYLMGPSLVYDFDFRNFLPKVMRDIREAQLNTGLIPDIAPEYTVFDKGFRDSPEWGSAGVMLPWMSWQWYGDKTAIEKSYSSMKAYANYLQSQAKGGILAYGLGDWYDIAPGPPGPSKLTPEGVTSTATYYADLKVIASAAKLMGQEAEAEAFEARARTERKAFQQAFYKSAENSYASGSQTSLAMPVVTGIAEPDKREALVKKLIADIRAKGNHTTAGDIGYRYVIEALTNYHVSDVVYDMATEKTAPSYGGQLAAGATTLTEAWDANPASSQNHLMLGHIEEWFYNGLAGIRPVFSPEGGLAHLDIEPSPVGDLTEVNAEWGSNRGTVKVAWTVKGSIFELTLDVPPGLDAAVHLPGTDQKAVKAAPEAKFVKLEGQKVIYQVEAGHYNFAVSHFTK